MYYELSFFKDLRLCSRFKLFARSRWLMSSPLSSLGGFSNFDRPLFLYKELF